MSEKLRDRLDEIQAKFREQDSLIEKELQLHREEQGSINSHIENLEARLHELTLSVEENESQREELAAKHNDQAYQLVVGAMAHSIDSLEPAGPFMTERLRLDEKYETMMKAEPKLEEHFAEFMEVEGQRDLLPSMYLRFHEKMRGNLTPFLELKKRNKGLRYEEPINIKIVALLEDSESAQMACWSLPCQAGNQAQESDEEDATRVLREVLVKSITGLVKEQGWQLSDVDTQTTWSGMLMVASPFRNDGKWAADEEAEKSFHDYFLNESPLRDCNVQLELVRVSQEIWQLGLETQSAVVGETVPEGISPELGEIEDKKTPPKNNQPTNVELEPEAAEVQETNAKSSNGHRSTGELAVATGELIPPETDPEQPSEGAPDQPVDEIVIEDEGATLAGDELPSQSEVVESQERDPVNQTEVSASEEGKNAQAIRKRKKGSTGLLDRLAELERRLRNDDEDMPAEVVEYDPDSPEEVELKPTGILEWLDELGFETLPTAEDASPAAEIVYNNSNNAWPTDEQLQPIETDAGRSTGTVEVLAEQRSGFYTMNDILAWERPLPQGTDSLWTEQARRLRTLLIRMITKGYIGKTGLSQETLVKPLPEQHRDPMRKGINRLLKEDILLEMFPNGETESMLTLNPEELDQIQALVNREVTNFWESIIN